MAQLTLDEIRNMQGGTLVDSTGDKVGKIEDIYLDQDTNEPEWALVTTGLFGSKQTFVPLANARMQGTDTIMAGVSKDQVKGAPTVDAEGELSEQEEAQLYQHYGISYSDSQSNDAASGTTYADTTGTAQQQVTTTQQVASTPPPQPAPQPARQDDGTITRSEEELRVQKVRRPSQLVRLRKYITTEQVSTTVPVQREEVSISREPITQANMGDAMSGPDLTEREVEVVLESEDVQVQKQVVPKERIRVDKEVVTEERQVTEELRKEQIDVERGTTTTQTGTTQTTTQPGQVDPNLNR